MINVPRTSFSRRSDFEILLFVDQNRFDLETRVEDKIFEILNSFIRWKIFFIIFESFILTFLFLKLRDTKGNGGVTCSNFLLFRPIIEWTSRNGQ